MKYKQYLWFDSGRDEIKPISCLKAEDGDKLRDFLENFGLFYRRDDFSNMRISFIDGHGDETENLWGFKTSEDFDGGHIPMFFANNYTYGILGKIPNLIPTHVRINRHRLTVYLNYFDDEQKSQDWADVSVCSFPLGAKMKIEVEPSADFDPDTYIVMNRGTDSTNMALVVEEYRNSVLLRTCELGRDQEGDFELITEA